MFTFTSMKASKMVTVQLLKALFRSLMDNLKYSVQVLADVKSVMTAAHKVLRSWCCGSRCTQHTTCSIERNGIKIMLANISDLGSNTAY